MFWEEKEGCEETLWEKFENTIETLTKKTVFFPQQPLFHSSLCPLFHQHRESLYIPEILIMTKE